MALFACDEWDIGENDYPCDDCEDREMYYTAKMDAIQQELLPLFRHLRGRMELSQEEIDSLIDSLIDEVGFRRPEWAQFEREGDAK